MADKQHIDSKTSAIHEDDDLPITEVHSHIPGNAVLPGTNQDSPTDPDMPLLPNYQIRRLINQGGMGAVYLARDVKLNRLVALKMLLPRYSSVAKLLNRFHTEAAAIARLQHPNIIQIYDTGELNNRPFLALEYCSGGNLEERTKQTPMAPGEAARLVATLAEAVEVAHRAGILHRDLKPANVLFSTDGTPKVTDFGLAKVVHIDSNETQPGEFLGTPSYMAPEQAAAKHRELGPAADVYSLGAMLYKLLTGAPPFKAATSAETVMQVRYLDPVPVRQLQPKTPRDLETICLKCLEKDPNRRYASAQQLADDLHRFLIGEAIWAKPAHPWHRLEKFVRRHPTTSALSFLILALLILSISGISLALQQALVDKRLAETAGAQAKQSGAEAEREKQLAVAARTEAEQTLSLTQLLLAQTAWNDNRLPQANAWLDAIPSNLRGWEWNFLKRSFHGGLATLCPNAKYITSVAVNPQATRFAAATEDGTIVLWELPDRTQLRILKGPKADVAEMAFHPDGNRLVVAYIDNTNVFLWDTDKGTVLHELDADKKDSLCVLFADGGRRVLGTGVSGILREWDTETGQLLEQTPLNHGWIYQLAYHEPTRRLAVGCKNGTIALFDVSGKDKTPLWANTDRKSQVECLAIHPNGRMLVSANRTSDLVCRDMATGRAFANLDGHQQGITSAAFSPDGRLLATGSRDTSALVWDMENRQLLLPLRGHTKRITDVAFAGPGTVITGSLDHTVKVWNTISSLALLESYQLPCSVDAAELSPDGTCLATFTPDTREAKRGTVKLWKVGASVPFGETPVRDLLAMHWDSDSRNLQVLKTDGVLTILDAETGTLQPDSSVFLPKNVASVGWCPTQPLVAFGFYEREILVQNLVNDEEFTLPGHLRAEWLNAKDQDRKEMRKFEIVGPMAFSPTGKSLVSASKLKSLMVWDLRTKTGQDLPDNDQQISRLLFTPDGKRFLSGTDNGRISMWDRATGIKPLTFQAHATDCKIVGLAFRENGSLLLSVGRDGTVRIWDGRPLTQ